MFVVVPAKRRLARRAGIHGHRRIDRASLGPELAAAWDDAERVHGFRVDEHSFISVFEALRRPA